MLVGIFIQILCFIYLPIPLAILFTIILAFFSHFIVDAFAVITFHPPEPQKGDLAKFWKTWGLVTIIITIAFVVWIIMIGMFWFFFLGGFFSVLVDIIDWGIIRPIIYKKNTTTKESIWLENCFFHKMIDKLREKTLFRLPNWNYEKKGIIPELIIIAVLWILVVILISLL